MHAPMKTVAGRRSASPWASTRTKRMISNSEITNESGIAGKRATLRKCFWFLVSCFDEGYRIPVTTVDAEASAFASTFNALPLQIERARFLPSPFRLRRRYDHAARRPCCLVTAATWPSPSLNWASNSFSAAASEARPWLAAVCSSTMAAFCWVPWSMVLTAVLIS